MIKVKDMPTFRDVLDEALQNDEFRAEWERTALARTVAVAVAGYRARHGLSQRALARALGMQRSAVARLELGEHNPSVETLQRLSQALGIHFAIDLAPPGSQERWVTPTSVVAVREEFTAAAGGRVLIAAG